MKAFLQNIKFKLATVWWDVAQGDNRHIWRAVIIISAAAGAAVGKSL